MKYYHDLTNIQLNKGSVITLGKFDGIHVGHQKIMNIVKEKAKEYDLLSVVFTFDHMPVSLSQNTGQQYIMTNYEKRILLKEMGMDVLVEYPFTNEFMNMEARDFLVNVFLKQMKAKCIVVGTDCSFGKDKKGDAKMLVDLAEELGYEAIVVDKEMYEDREISSTYIRQELVVGHMETVNVLMGRPFSVNGIVMKGNQLGKTIDLPTINIYPSSGKLLPPYGVYSSKTLIKGKEYFGVTNVGTKPTVQKDNEISIETHLFGLDEDLYGEEVFVKLIHFQRPEMKFGDIEQLKKQMNFDATFAKDLFLLN